jgi:hypothetical protein
LCNRNRKKTKKVKCLSKYYLFIPSVKCYHTIVRKKDKKITKIPFWPKSPSHKRKAGFLKKLVRCESILLIYYPPKHLVTSLEEHPAVYPAAGCSSFCLPYVFITFIMYRYRADALKTDICFVHYSTRPFEGSGRAWLCCNLCTEGG